MPSFLSFASLANSSAIDDGGISCISCATLPTVLVGFR
jgi:hypothetical protein